MKTEATAQSSTPANLESSITHSKVLFEPIDTRARAHTHTEIYIYIYICYYCAYMNLSICLEQSLIFSRNEEAREEGKEFLKEEFPVCAQKKEAAQVYVQNESF